MVMDPGPSRPRSSGSGDPLDQRFERWLDRGRQLVDGVSGARPGSPRERPRRAGARPPLPNLGRWVENGLDWLLEDDETWREPWQQAPLGGRRGAGARLDAGVDRAARFDPTRPGRTGGTDGPPGAAAEWRQGGAGAAAAGEVPGSSGSRRGLEARSRRPVAASVRPQAPPSPLPAAPMDVPPPRLTTRPTAPAAAQPPVAPDLPAALEAPAGPPAADTAPPAADAAPRRPLPRSSRRRS